MNVHYVRLIGKWNVKIDKHTQKYVNWKKTKRTDDLRRNIKEIILKKVEDKLETAQLTP